MRFFFVCFIAAFMCHHNTFLVYQSMRDATLERWEKLTHISIAFAWVVAALFGITGYATFKALSQGKLTAPLHTILDYSAKGFAWFMFFFRIYSAFKRRNVVLFSVSKIKHIT